MGLESVFKISVLLNMVDQITSPMNKAAGSIEKDINKVKDTTKTVPPVVDDATNKTTESLKRMSDAFDGMQKMGGVMVGLGTAGVAAGAKLVSSTFDTQNALGELRSLGVEDLKAVEKAAKNFSDTWAGTTKSDFITASYDIKSGIASLTDEGVAQFTELAALTGKATKSTTEEMGSLFATGYGIYKSYYDDMSDLDFGEMFSAGIATAVKNYKTSGSQMAASISMLGATATNNNVPLEEQLAILGQLQTTMSGSEAATKYKAFLNQAAKAGAELGLTFTDANNQLLSTPDILDALRSKYGDTIDAVEKQELKKAFGTDEAVAMIDLLYQNVGSLRTGVDDLAGSMKKGTAVTKEMAQAIQAQPEQKFQAIKQQIHNNVEELAGNLLPTVNEVGDKVSGIIQKGSDWIENNQQTVQSITKVAVAMTGFLLIGGSVLTVVGTVAKSIITMHNAFNIAKGAVNGLKSAATVAKASMTGLNATFLASPITWVIAAIAALVAVFIVMWNRSEAFRSFWLSLFDQVRAAVLGAWQTIKPALEELGSSLMNLWQAIQPIIDIILQVGTVVLVVLAGLFMGALKGVIAALEPLIKALTNVVDFITNVVNAAVALFSGDFSGALEYAKAAVGNFSDFFINIFDGILSFLGGFADGFLSVIDTAFSSLGINISGKIAPIKDGIASGLSGVKEVFGTVFDACRDTAQEKLDNIKNAYEQHGGGIEGVTAAALEGVKGIYTSGLTFVDNLSGGKLTAIKNKFSNKCSEIRNTVSEKFDGIKDTVSNKIDAVKNDVDTGMQNAKVAATRQLVSMKNAYEQHGGGIKGTVAAMMTGMQNTFNAGYTFINNITGGRLESVRKTVSDKLNAAKGIVLNIFEGIRSTVRDKIEAAADAVRTAIDKIKEFFNFKWELPKLKMPSIDIQGKWSMNPPQVPKFSVKWNAEGAVLNGAQIFGQVGNTYLGGGEAGQEAVLPLSTLWDKMGAILRDILDDDDKPDDKPKNTAVEISNFITQKAASVHRETIREKTKETVNNNKEIAGSKTVNNYWNITVNPKMEDIEDLEKLKDLISEIEDRSNNTDYELEPVLT